MTRQSRRTPRYFREGQAQAAAIPIDWDEYHRMLRPFQDAAKRVREGDPAGLPVAVDYLVRQPRFFGSGYLFEEMASALAVGADAGAFVSDIHEAILSVARQPLRRETRYTARLAARYWDEALEAELRGIPTGAARRMLARAPGIRDSYRGFGLVRGGRAD